MLLCAVSMMTPTYDPKVGWSRMIDVTGGTFPRWEEFEARFNAVCANSNNLLSFGNDPFVGTDNLTCEQLWEILHEVWNNSESLDPETQMPGIDEAYNWCSTVLGILGWNWV